MKKRNTIKYVLRFIIVIAMIVNCFANAVGDNDGSAFISKAEFDSLKNNFQTQIDKYNTSIDAKIDEAIAGYLAGIKADLEVEMKSLIDNEGVYGNKMKTTWSSATNYRMISTTYPYPVHKHSWFTVKADIKYSGSYINKGTTKFYSGIWDIPFMNRFGTEISNFDDGTKNEYRVETVKIRDVNYRMLQYVKVVNIFNFVQFYGFPTNQSNGAGESTTVTGWTAINFLQENLDKLTQQNLLLGEPMDYYRWWAASSSDFEGLANWSVMKTGCAMITQDYEADENHVISPFSTIQEYVWDPKSEVTLTVPNDAFRPSNPKSALSTVYWEGNNQGNTSRTTVLLNSQHPSGLYFTWQHLLFKDGEKNESGNNVQAKDAIIYNYYDIDKRNRAQKNGLVIGTTPRTNDVEVICQCSSDVNGTVYFFVGDDPISNWTDSSFTGKKYDLVANEPDIKCSLGKCKANKPIWVLFKPASTAVKGKLKVGKLYYKKEVTQ